MNNCRVTMPNYNPVNVVQAIPYVILNESQTDGRERMINLILREEGTDSSGSTTTLLKVIDRPSETKWCCRIMLVVALLLIAITAIVVVYWWLISLWYSITDLTVGMGIYNKFYQKKKKKFKKVTLIRQLTIWNL